VSDRFRGFSHFEKQILFLKITYHNYQNPSLINFIQKAAKTTRHLLKLTKHKLTKNQYKGLNPKKKRNKTTIRSNPFLKTETKENRGREKLKIEFF